ncbi:DNA mismatch repair protein MutL [Verrucomicrobium sp. GAS474]|uniref:DNA mismatch repair endonuclease MutL n=1 Tax=Verrucomicrobium sp. GAS474 TaxID=1882831 RepID=UPI00087DEEC6|nr:DNA mismatch repair endonuclease MutL [Verrucomicrobium sp. GAS474]SDT87541.1 DNA mismatch repair protein MutL [Verrucomicrobium sp. GAS474]
MASSPAPSPSRIRLLSEHVANQIAAGEVIERPASVLKELLENALDARSRRVGVRTRGGGRSLVEVIDDGHGMNRDDALLCLERHATSKLRDTDDLRHLLSYGFRGEALPSIASVSKFLLQTQEPGAIEGTEISIHGGKLLSVREAGLAHGTRVEVRSLFYNLPARRKFLRTEKTELSHLQHILLLAGLARPDVGFDIVHDDDAPVRWPAGQDLQRRIASIFGPAWGADLVPVSGEDGDLKLTGFIGRPGVSRATRQEQFLFVNKRPVESRTLHYALQEGYHNALMRGRYPVTVLFLDLAPEDLDVNIHPAKREVRFHDEGRIRFFLKKAVQKALEGFADAPLSVSLGAGPGSDVPAPSVREIASPRYGIASRLAPPPASPGREAAPIARTPDEALPPRQSDLPIPREETPLAPLPRPGLDPLPSAPLRPEPEPEPDSAAAASPAPLGFRLLGILAKLYLVAESPEGLVLIDQHAAHERILFEKLLDRLRRREVESQRLLLPVTVELPPRESAFLESEIASLQAIGLGIAPFGARTFVVDALPPMIANTKHGANVPELIRNLLADLQEEGGETRKERRLSEETVAKKACRFAVKANDRLSPPEAERLLLDLMACHLPYTCPHGRPTMIQITKPELEKKFGRIV